MQFGFKHPCITHDITLGDQTELQAKLRHGYTSIPGALLYGMHLAITGPDGNPGKLKRVNM